MTRSFNTLLPYSSAISRFKPALLSMLIGCSMVVAGCNQAPKTKADASTDNTESKTELKTDTNTDNNEQTAQQSQNDSDTQPMMSTQDKPLEINWRALDSGEQAVDPKSFKYPFALDSDAVQAQAKFSGISPEQAQHSLTVGMASNEPLEKLLDQLADSYVSHSYSEKDAKLIVYTTPNVTPSEYDYVIKHEFARGLILPIEIMPSPEGKADAASNTAAH